MVIHMESRLILDVVGTSRVFKDNSHIILLVIDYETNN